MINCADIKDVFNEYVIKVSEIFYPLQINIQIILFSYVNNDFDIQ